MQKTVLCVGGEMPEAGRVEELLRSSDLVVAADSGFDKLWEAGIEPDLVVGDMDSTNYREKISLLPEEKVETAWRDKEETDTEIGLRRSYELGAEYIILIGGGGGRLDHLLGILALFDRDMRPHEWYTARERVVSIESERAFHYGKGETVSLFPVGGGVTKLKSRGLKWPLDNLVWKRGDVGISNVVSDSPIVLEPIEGRALFIAPFAGTLYG